jgi:purine-binding chemotaxis protein CheW
MESVMSETVDVARKYVTLKLGSDIYAIDVMNVQEITDIPEVVKIPHALPFMKGMSNLRGRVVPLIDLKEKFLMPETEYTKLTVVIIVEIGEILIGFIVDSVSDVVDLTDEQIQITPQFKTAISGDFIKGIVELDETMVVILNVENILNKEELSLLDDKTEEEENEEDEIEVKETEHMEDEEEEQNGGTNE